MEPKIEPWMHLAAIKIVEHFNEARSGFQFGMAWENSTQLIIARNFPRVPSSPAPRLEFQLDRISETEWSADTWLVLPSGKRDVLGWIPCDSQDDADREVATLKKLYAEAVPSSPAAPMPPRKMILPEHQRHDGDNPVHDACPDCRGAGCTPVIEPCSSSSPCGEIVAKGVCDKGMLSLHEHNRDKFRNFIRCVNWRHTHNVCLGCGREEPV